MKSKTGAISDSTKWAFVQQFFFKKIMIPLKIQQVVVQIPNASDPMFFTAMLPFFSQVQCFSYPMTTFYTPLFTIPSMYKNLLDMLRDNIDYQTKRPNGIVKVLIKYKEHLTSFSKANFANVVLASEFSKIPNDLKYYKQRFGQSYDVIKTMLSALDSSGIYKSFYDVLRSQTKFKMAPLNEGDIMNTTFFKLGMKLRDEGESIKRCQWDKIMCSCDKAEDNLISNVIREFCFFTGQKFFNMTKKFNAAVDAYIEAYNSLEEHLRSYLEEWKSLHEDYFQ